MDHWKDKTITVNDAWGAGANNLLRAPLASAPEFSLRGRYHRDARAARQLVQFQAEISSGYLSDGWHSAVFTPVGTTDVQGIFGLPPWDPSHADAYRNMILGPDNNLGDSRTSRLEGVIPYVDANRAVGYDTVRLFYVFNAVQGAPISDLVIVKISTFAAVPGTVQIRQDGAGHGPPN